MLLGLLVFFPSIRSGLYHYFGMCYHCFALPCKYKTNVIVYHEGYLICEEELVCKRCGKQHDYFSYGSTKSEYSHGEYEMDYPIMNALFKKLSELYNTAIVLYNRG